MTIVFEKFSQPLAAAYKWDIGVAGSYLRLSACQWPCTVLLYKQGRIIGQMANMLAGDYVEGVDFDAVSVLNGSTAQTIDIQISGGGAGSNRVLGEVSVINGEIQRVKAGGAFIGYAAASAVPGQMSHNQLWNPAGSGKNLILTKISVLPSTSAAIGLGTSVAALLALTGAAGSKKLGGAAPLAELRGATYAALQGIQVGNFSIVSGSMDFSFSEPLVAPPGNGVIIFSSLVNINLYTTFQWFEEPV